jgi:hypothetical protein
MYLKCKLKREYENKLNTSTYQSFAQIVHIFQSKALLYSL